MSETFRCEDKETLVAYLYGEIDADDRREVERHLRACSACASETEGLQAVRRDLEAWMPPEPQLGFTISQKPAAVLRPSRWSLPAIPVWAQAAAAVLVIAASAAIANLQVRYGSDGLTVTTGWMQPSTQLPASTQTPAAVAQDWQPALSALERDLRNELASMRRTSSPEPITTKNESPATIDSTAILRRVQAMLDESEQRQRQELALRVTQVRREAEMNRQADLIRIDRTFGTLQGRAFKTAADQQEVMNLLRRVSVQPNQ